MPLSGKGMLINFMNVDASDEPDFNRWYDKEHLAERVAIPGFLEARRYLAHEAPSKYLALYTTETFDVLTSPAYKERVANQTEWSLRNIAKFRNATRALARVTASLGQGRGSALAFIRIRPDEDRADTVRRQLSGGLAKLVERDGIVSAHLLESDRHLSRPLTEDPAAAQGAGDWYVLIDGTGIDAVREGADALALDTPGGTSVPVVSRGFYGLLWDLSKSELSVQG